MKNIKILYIPIFIILCIVAVLFNLDINNILEIINFSENVVGDKQNSSLSNSVDNNSENGLFTVYSPSEAKDSNENLLMFAYNNFDLNSTSHLVAVTSISIALVFLNLVFCYNIMIRYYTAIILIILRDKYLKLDSPYYNKLTKLHDFLEKYNGFFNRVSIFNLAIINSCLFFGLLVTLQIVVRTTGG